MNIVLDLSVMATTLTLSSLLAQLLLEVLGKSTWFVGVRMIQRGFKGDLQVLRPNTRLTQELRPKV